MTSEKAVEVLRKIKVYASGDDLEALDMAIESIIYDYARGVQKGLEIATINGSDKRKPGHWIPTQNPQWKAYYHDKCSVCGWWNTKNAVCRDIKKKARSLNYCPNCGADMRGTEDD